MQITYVEMTVHGRSGTEQRSLPVGSVSGARFCSRDVAGMRKEMDEQLERDGRFTMATLTNPSIFHLGRYLLTQSPDFEVQGSMTGGEAEVVAIRDGQEILISVGSDQCDRELDPLFPDKPKQMCPHPLARTAWPYDEVRPHWDELRIFSHVVVGEHTVPLQDSKISELVDLEYLLKMNEVQSLADPMVLYCGCGSFLDSVDETRPAVGPSTGNGAGRGRRLPGGPQRPGIGPHHPTRVPGGSAGGRPAIPARLRSAVPRGVNEKRGVGMPKLTVEGVGDFDVDAGKRLVLALTDEAGIDQLHACGGNARCTTCRVEFVEGEPSRMTAAEKKVLEMRRVTGVRLSCQIRCDHEMTVRIISRLAGSGRRDAGRRPADEIQPQPVEYVDLA